MLKPKTKIMERKLIIANTYYQLIVAIQLSKTLFKNDEVIVLLSDHSRDAEKICAQLNKLQIFKKTYYFKTKNLLKNRKTLRKAKDFVQIILGKQNQYVHLLGGLNGLIIDEIICYNYGADVEGLFACLYEAHTNLKVSFYEEGILSYGVCRHLNMRQKYIKLLRHLLGKKNITDVYKNFYCFYPSLYKDMLTPVLIPHINCYSKCAEELRKLFNLSNVNTQYPEKYIFFTSVYDFEGEEPIGEYELVCKIAAFIGKNNLLIKVHPRDTRGIYEKNGYKVDKNSSIPWEAIQLLGDFGNKVFLTATSGSVLSGSLMSEAVPKIIYLFNCCNILGNKFAKITVKNIIDLLSDSDMQKVLGNILIAQKIEDIIN